MAVKQRNYQIAIGILVIIIAALVVLQFFSSRGITADRETAEKNVVALYSVISNNAEVLKTTEENGLFRIVVRFQDALGQDTVQDLFVTLDGKMLTDRLFDIEAQRIALQQQSDFAQCLFDNQVRVFGLNNDPVTQAQLQILGAFSRSIYFDCGSNAQLCQQMNITQVPAILLNNQVIQGPQPVDWFEQNTGCSFAGTGGAAGETVESAETSEG